MKSSLRALRRGRLSYGCREYSTPIDVLVSSPSPPPPPPLNLSTDVQTFLRRRTSYTLLPAPLPAENSSPLNDFYFTDSPTQDHLAIMDACLHNAYNIPRAHAIFGRLRQKNRKSGLLSAKVYNEFLDAYLGLANAAGLEENGEAASTLNANLKGVWRTSQKYIDEAWSLYEAMEVGEEGVAPNSNTYAIMLLFCLRFNNIPESGFGPQPTGSEEISTRTPHALLGPIIGREISLASLLASPVFTSSSDVSSIISMLSRAAVDSNTRGVVEELGRMQALANNSTDNKEGVEEGGDNPWRDVPEVLPVMKLNMKKGLATDVASSSPNEDSSSSPSSSVTSLSSPEPETNTEEAPFNLSILRTHLAQASYARLVLPLSSDAVHRQKLLEASAYDVAVSRLQQTTQKIEDMGLGPLGFGTLELGGSSTSKARTVKQWMYEWHQELLPKLEEAIEDVVLKEREAEDMLKAEPKKKSKGKQANLSPDRQQASFDPTLLPTNPHLIKLGPFLSLLSPMKLSLITITELMRLQGTGGINGGMKTARALLSVGKSVEMEYVAEVLKKRDGGLKGNIALKGGRLGGIVPYGLARRIGRAARRPTSREAPDSALDSDTSQIPESSSTSLTTSTSEPTPESFFRMSAYDRLHSWRKSALRYEEEEEGGIDWTASWTPPLRARIGSFLVDLLMNVATVRRTGVNKKTGLEVEEEHPAFFHSYEYVRGHKLGVIRLNQVIADELAKDGVGETLHPRHLPMLIPPKPWLSHNNGGYIYSISSVMRYKDTAEQLTYLREATDLGHLEILYAGLDVLGSTPWRINRPVFDIVLRVWNSGEAFLKIPPAAYDEPEPVRPETAEHNANERMKWLMRMRGWSTKKANAHSERCSVNYKIEIARAFLGDKFYLPHNIDFRGRAYPIPPHLSHVGDDLSRGLLTFAEGKPLGERGLRWLKIHLANLYGYDKGSFEERVKFVEDNVENIFDSAEKPLEGSRWWTKADDPWQCLACCFELRSALNSPDPLAFVSSLPVHQDGTCNGLQHYAALGGDDRGARQVNLAEADRPSDVYTYVAQMVSEQIDRDAEMGSEVAKMVQGLITRKVVKQTVMTTVYGVTFIGARAQIEKQLKDKTSLPAENCWHAASYIAKVTIAAIGDLFKGAKEIQTWLTTCARLIAKAIPESRIRDQFLDSNNPTTLPLSRARKKITEEGEEKEESPFSRTSKALTKEQMSTVIWTTPLGLPVVQPYRKVKRKQIMTALQTVYISDPNSPSEVNAQKQASAFPPNFIHSLDATHMMLTALECKSSNLDFASVHDSYWTHAATIDRMSEIIRETFIALHESDILERLRHEFLERYKDYKIPLVMLRAKSIIKHIQLPSSVVKLVASPEQVKELEELPGEETSFPVEVDDSADPGSISTGEMDLEELAGEKEEVDPADSELELDLDLEYPDKEAKMPRKSTRKRKAVKATKAEIDKEAAVLRKFVNLTDVIPPLPKKGNFDVKTIKRSKYFFS